MQPKHQQLFSRHAGIAHPMLDGTLQQNNQQMKLNVTNAVISLCYMLMHVLQCITISVKQKYGYHSNGCCCKTPVKLGNHSFQLHSVYQYDLMSLMFIFLPTTPKWCETKKLRYITVLMVKVMIKCAIWRQLSLGNCPQETETQTDDMNDESRVASLEKKYSIYFLFKSYDIGLLVYLH